MEQNIKFIFFTNIPMFFLLYWICYFYSDMSKINKFLRKNYGFGRNLDTQIYRLLGNCEKNIYSNFGNLKGKILYNTRKKNENLFTVDNEKWAKEKSEKLYKSSLVKEKLIKKLMKSKCTLLHGSYSHYEKKIMNGINDKGFFKKMMLINDKDYKNLKRKKYRLHLCLLLLMFILLFIIPIIDLSLGDFKSIGSLLFVLCQLIHGKSSGSQVPLPSGDSGTFWSSICYGNNMEKAYRAGSILMYCLPILIMGMILILGTFCYYKKVIKRKKIKFLEEFNEW
ncbi:hypothetical protein MKS88_001572 [Plasmodium brasilianum]|uniref:Uncharacterized protein n=1 Tax=Plasmodium brasilianum TaxID=5824 RepID=A0ACB9YD22_PLABR|nr:hypothetical protein MKS88_001572 [Plasmodium brasilianum]